MKKYTTVAFLHSEESNDLITEDSNAYVFSSFNSNSRFNDYQKTIQTIVLLSHARNGITTIKSNSTIVLVQQLTKKIFADKIRISFTFRSRKHPDIEFILQNTDSRCISKKIYQNRLDIVFELNHPACLNEFRVAASNKNGPLEIIHAEIIVSFCEPFSSKSAIFAIDELQADKILVDTEEIKATLVRSNLYADNIAIPKIVAKTAPSVSIVIPTYENQQITEQCIKSIIEHTKDVPYKIIIADDSPTTDTVKYLLKLFPDITIKKNHGQKGFSTNCNNASKNITDKYMVLLNNDTLVHPGWLWHLLQIAENDATAGIVGPKFVYPNGRLQEAGSIVWSDGNAWNYGKNDDPAKPQYNYVKEVDYISGAALLIKTDLWRAIGGFDKRFHPAYWEDPDLCFEARKRGFKTIFQPKSVVTHIEGASYGSDVEKNTKKSFLMSRNQNIFKTKWSKELDAEHLQTLNGTFQSRDRSHKTKTILIIDHYVPLYDRDCGSKALWQYLKLFKKMGFNVIFFPDNYAASEPYTTSLQQNGIEVLYGYHYQQIDKWLDVNGKYIDYVIACRPHIASKHINTIREKTNAKLIYLAVDLHYLRSKRAYDLTGEKNHLIESEKWKNIEFSIFRKCDVTYLYSKAEKELILSESPEISCRDIPLYIAGPEQTIADLNARNNNILFVGGFSHNPNVDAAMWLCNEIFPILKLAIPDATIMIAGSNPPKNITDLGARDGIETFFNISDETLNRLYDKAKIAVAPLRYGAGMKGKIIEAMYRGIPIITTTIGAEGLNNENDILIVTDTIDGFVDNILWLLRDNKKCEQISSNALAYSAIHFSEQNAINCISHDITLGD